jgi:tetratricopeptide (TPR) repeat protein
MNRGKRRLQSRITQYAPMSTDRLEALQSFHEEDPDDAFTRFALAREHLKRGHPDEALAHFEALVEEQPGYTGTYYHLGKLYARLGRPEDAKATYRAGVEECEEQGATKDLSELRDALMQAEGVGLG